MHLKVNYLRGVNNVVFGMSPDNVFDMLGKADSTTKITIPDDEFPTKRTEVRNKLKFMYEEEKLVCICGDLGAPFFLDEDRIPVTFMEAYRLLKEKSKINMRFPKSTCYVFADLGIVMYPCTITELDGGISNTTTKYRVALCNMKILKRYSQYLIKNDGKENEDLSAYLLGHLGSFADNCDKLKD